MLLFSRGGEAQTAKVEYDGKTLAVLPLSGEEKEYTYTFPEGSITLLAGEKGVCVSSSDCPDKDCVRRGWVKKRGDALVCLPLLFSVTPQGPAEVDGVTG